MTTEQQIRAKHERDKSDGFTEWLHQPTTKILISLLPGSEHTVEVLRAAYQSGFDRGSAITAIDMLASIMGRPRRE